MTCRPDCYAGPAQAHCGSCHETFGGVRGFDEHRRNRRCLPPPELGMTLDARRVWRRWVPPAERARLAGLWRADS